MIFWLTFSRVTDHGCLGHGTCPNCNNDVDFFLRRNVRWLVFCFIPIPMETQFFHLCPICTRGHVIPNKVAKQIMRDMKAGAAVSVPTA